MALLIPDFEPMEKLPGSKEAWQEIYCELVTPIYGGGVQAAIPDISMPIRATAIRGQLLYNETNQILHYTQICLAFITHKNET